VGRRKEGEGRRGLEEGGAEWIGGVKEEEVKTEEEEIGCEEE
jgi:hypothetical protein